MILSDWMPVAVPALLTIIALWGPGLLVTSALGIGKWRAVAFAPLASAGLLGGTAVLGPFIGIDFGWGIYLGVTIAVSLVIFLTSKLVGGLAKRQRSSASEGMDSASADATPDPKIWPAFVGMLITVPFTALAFMNAVVKPEFPNQSWDAIFHLSAIRWIMETGNGSALNLGAVATSLTEAESTAGGFYPAGFHDLVSLTVTDNVIVATNAVVLVISSILWPLAVSMLSSIFVPSSKTLPLFTAILAASFTSFPERIASYGVLWPTVFSYALVPLLTIALADWYGRTNQRPLGIKTTIVLLLGGIGVGTAHPTGVFVALIVVGILAVDLFVRLIAGTATSKKWQSAVLIGIPVGTIFFLLFIRDHPVFKMVTNWYREPVGSLKREMFGVVFESQLPWLSYGDPKIDWLLGILTIIGGLVALWMSNTRWLAFVYAAVGYLFVVSAVVDLPGYAFVRVFYSDPPRLGAIVPLFGAPIAGLGAWFLYSALIKHLRSPNARKIFQRPAAILVIVGLIIGTEFIRYRPSVAQLRHNYAFSDKSGFNALVSKDELDFIETLPNYVQKGDVILGDPRTGLPFVYALTGLDVSFRHFNGSWSDDYKEMAENFYTAVNSDPEMCQLLADNHVRYFYTDDIIFWPESPTGQQYSGLATTHDLTDAFSLVAEGGGAALYEITTCPNLDN